MALNIGVKALELLNQSQNSFDSNDLMSGVEDVQVRLKFISRIEVGDKINVRNLFLQRDSVITRVSRTIYNLDNRKNTLKFIQDVITRTFEVIQMLVLTNDKQGFLTCKNIITDLISARKGMNNLKGTYTEDIMFTCQMETLLQKIENKIVSLKLSYPMLFEQSSPVIQPLSEQSEVKTMDI